MKKAVIIVAAIMIFFVAAAFIAPFILDGVARSKAKEMCGSAKPGMSKEELIGLVNEKGGDTTYFSEELITVGASAPMLVCRCDVNMKKGVIVSTSILRCIQ